MKQKNTKREYKIVLLLALLLPLLFFLSINVGYTDIKLTELFQVMTGGGSPRNNIVVFQFRLPRIVIAMLVGAGFSLSGCILQGITKNPLADPGLMGINAGAGIVVLTFMVLSGTLTTGWILSLPVFSLAGALLTGSVIYLLSNRKDYGISPMRLVLNGVAIQAGINAVMTLLVLKLDDTQAEFLAAWQAGSIWNSTWNSAIALLPWILMGFICLIFMAGKLDILAMGDEISLGLGIAVVKEKRKLLFLAVALAAASVAISGNINFVGLIAPHLSRRLVGARHKILLPTSALVGAILVTGADIISRTIIKPAEIPNGIVVSIIGAPYFIVLLIINRRAAVS